MILSKSQLVENIVTELSDNSTGQISPYDIRHNLLDIIDSVHLLTGDQNLKAKNFSTPATRTTRVGEESIKDLGLEGYVSEDNTAIGFESLKSNYQGFKNTAIGSKSLSCNVYGENNVGVGYLALSSNSTGIGNVGVGSLSLANNRVGNFNIAIGHAAGYYVDRDSNYKLFVAAHPVDEEYLCDNPSGSGLIPLIHGDLSGIKLGIGVRELHNNSTLQVGGNITPSGSDLCSLGNTNLYWKNLYLSDSLIHSSGNTSIAFKSSDIILAGHIYPSTNNLQNFGSVDKRWNTAFFKEITTDKANIGVLNAVESCFYPCKTIYLAASGCDNNFDLCDYLSDEQLLGAGFSVYSDNGGTVRNYKLDFSPPSSGSSFETNLFAKARWNSNISIAVATGVSVITNRLISHHQNGHGLYFNSGITFITDNNLFSNRTNVAGSGNFNLISSSGNSNPFFASIATVESGVNVGARFITGAKHKSLDPSNGNKERLRGFDLKYIDTANLNIIGDNPDRFIIGSYDNTSYNVNALCLMKNDGDSIVGINNFGPLSENVLPKTALDIRSTGNAIIRSTAENQSQTIAALQLLGEESCLFKGFEAAYLNTSGIADLSMYQDSGRRVFFRMHSDRRVGLFTSSGNANEMFTLGDIFHSKPVISLYEASGTITSSSKYGKVFARSKIATNQGTSLYLLDGSGNLHDLVVNKFDNLDGRALYTDANFNTFGGLYSNSNRASISSNTKNNTSLGYAALNNIGSGGSDNIGIGSHSSSGLTTGYQNIVIGNRSASSITTGHNNIVIGYNAFNSTSANINNNIIIGNSGLANASSGNFEFWLGANKDLVLLQGKTGPTNSDKILTMPSGGKMLLFNNNNSEGMALRNNTIEVLDFGGSDYPENELTFKFTGQKASDLLKINHNAEPLNQSANYTQPSPARPYAELRGDLRLLGSIRFSDNTSLASSAQVTTNQNNINILTSGVNSLNNSIASLVVEGYCPLKIVAPTNASSPTIGNLLVKNSSWQDETTVQLVNRDKNLNIPEGAYIIAIRVNNEYRPLWISAQNECNVCCN